MWRDDDNENYFNRKTSKRQMLYLNYCTFLSVKNAYVCFDILLLMCAMYKLLLLLYLSKTLSFVEKYVKNIMIYVRDYPFKRAKSLTKKKQNMCLFFPLLLSLIKFHGMCLLNVILFKTCTKKRSENPVPAFWFIGLFLIMSNQLTAFQEVAICTFTICRNRIKFKFVKVIIHIFS